MVTVIKAATYQHHNPNHARRPAGVSRWARPVASNWQSPSMPALKDKKGAPILPQTSTEEKIRAFYTKFPNYADMIQEALPNPLQVIEPIAKAVSGTVVYSVVGSGVTVGVCVGGTAMALYYTPNAITKLVNDLKEHGKRWEQQFFTPKPNQTHFDKHGNQIYPDKETQDTFQNAKRYELELQEQVRIQTELNKAHQLLDENKFDDAKKCLDQISESKMVYQKDRTTYRGLINQIDNHEQAQKDAFFAKQEQDTIYSHLKQLSIISYDTTAPGRSINRCCTLVDQMEHRFTQSNKKGFKNQWRACWRMGQIKESLMRIQYEATINAPHIGKTPHGLDHLKAIQEYIRDIGKVLTELPVGHPAINSIRPMLTEYAKRFEKTLPSVATALTNGVTQLTIQIELDDLTRSNENWRGETDTTQKLLIHQKRHKKAIELISTIQTAQKHTKQGNDYSPYLKTVYALVPSTSPAAIATQKAAEAAEAAKVTAAISKATHGQSHMKPTPLQQPNTPPTWLESSASFLKAVLGYNG